MKEEQRTALTADVGNPLPLFSAAALARPSFIKQPTAAGHNCAANTGPREAVTQSDNSDWQVVAEITRLACTVQVEVS